MSKKKLPDKPAQQRFYKVLRDGKSIYQHHPYPLPQNGEPGEWQEVSGALVEHRNGFHLTADPLALREKDFQCYEAEYEGDAIPGYEASSHLVVRRVRLTRYVPWATIREQFKVRGDGVGVREDPRHEVDSPALVLIQYVWKTLNAADRVVQTEASWRTINSAMRGALALAITSGMRFNPDDFNKIAELSSSYWLDWDRVYATACGHTWHGDTRNPNPSAYQAIEKYLGRTPFLITPSASRFWYGHKKPDGAKIRLHVGARFDWHVDLKTRVQVKVTSIVDKPADKPGKTVAGNPPPVRPYVVACSYKTKERDERGYETGPDKIDRQFKITHEDIAAYHAAIRDAAKRRKSAETAGAML